MLSASDCSLEIDFVTEVVNARENGGYPGCRWAVQMLRFVRLLAWLDDGSCCCYRRCRHLLNERITTTL